MRKNNVYEKDYIWNPSICACEIGKSLESITDDSVMTWDVV